MHRIHDTKNLLSQVWPLCLLSRASALGNHTPVEFMYTELVPVCCFKACLWHAIVLLSGIFMGNRQVSWSLPPFLVTFSDCSADTVLCPLRLCSKLHLLSHSSKLHVEYHYRPGARLPGFTFQYCYLPAWPRKVSLLYRVNICHSSFIMKCYQLHIEY